MQNRTESPYSKMRDNLVDLGSLLEHAPSIFFILIFPLKAYVTWNAKKIGFSNVEIKSLINRGKDIPYSQKKVNTTK